MFSFTSPKHPLLLYAGVNQLQRGSKDGIDVFFRTATLPSLYGRSLALLCRSGCSIAVNV